MTKMPTSCEHPNPVVSDVSDHGVPAEVTVCPDCNAALDYRLLREVDRPSGPVEAPTDEREIQARAKALKAQEVLEESGEIDALPVVLLKHPSEEEVHATLRSKAALLSTPTGKQPDEVHEVVAQKLGMGDWIEHPHLSRLAQPCPACGAVADPKGRCKTADCGLSGEVVIRERVVPTALTDPAPCGKHDGDLPECDTGKGKAHHCTNSKWGKLATFGGPCRCYGCHAA